MRIIHINSVTEVIKEMCIKANRIVSKDILKAFEYYKEKEISDIGKVVLNQLIENAELAKIKQVPICQDTGMAVVYLDIGQDIFFEGGYIEDAVNEGVRLGYEEGFLRKSVVLDPINRINSNDNTPAIIHYSIIKGDQLKITVAPKGFGSENMSRIYMLAPSDGIEGVKKAILETVEIGGSNPCPPIIVGVGIGGTFEKAAQLAKKALLRDIDSQSELPHIKELEIEMLEKINQLGIGPQGLGGITTALGVNIEVFPTHIAGLPVAINISCHVTRHESVIL